MIKLLFVRDAFHFPRNLLLDLADIERAEWDVLSCPHVHGDAARDNFSQSSGQRLIVPTRPDRVNHRTASTRACADLFSAVTMLSSRITAAAERTDHAELLGDQKR
jgi:hypothetical protein